MTSSEEITEDLRNMLSQLDPGMMRHTDTPWVEGEMEPLEVVTIPDPPQDVRTVDSEQSIITPTTEVINNNKQIVDVVKYLERLDEVTDEILDACRSDRTEAQDVITTIRNEINKALDADRPPMRMYVDGLVKAVEVKASINMTAVKMMETAAKTLAALKVQTNIQINNSQNGNTLVDSSDLKRVLDEPITAQDEY